VPSGGPPVSPLEPRKSTSRATDWHKALFDGDDNLLAELAASEPPGESLFELETFINGTYKGFEKNKHFTKLGFPLRSDAYASSEPSGETVATSVTGEQAISIARARSQAQIRRAVPVVQSIREGLGWETREFDIRFLRMMRKDCSLSVVLGAGASCAAPCGAPSWPALVRELLQITLDRGLQRGVPVRQETQGNSSEQALDEGAAGPSTRTTTWFEQRTVREYNDDERAQAQEYIRRIDAGESDGGLCAEAASLAHSLCGQNLFTYISQILYRDNRQPSDVHRAVARLAHPQDGYKGRTTGWEAIITYNFDAFMSQALDQEGVPSEAWAMRGNEMAIDPDKRAINLGRGHPLIQKVLHLHGYTPQRLFMITLVRFIFATQQYIDAYDQEPLPIFDEFVRDYLENPAHVVLYVGCSFIDQYMNLLLKRAISQSPGRFHYALLQWPRKRCGVVPSAEELRIEQERYLEMGVRPIWFDDFDEIPDIIARLE